MSDPKVPMICQNCGWRGMSDELITTGDDLHCPCCFDGTKLAQVLGAPLHESDDK